MIRKCPSPQLPRSKSQVSSLHLSSLKFDSSRESAGPKFGQNANLPITRPDLDPKAGWTPEAELPALLKAMDEVSSGGLRPTPGSNNPDLVLGPQGPVARVSRQLPLGSDGRTKNQFLSSVGAGPLSR